MNIFILTFMLINISLAIFLLNRVNKIYDFRKNMINQISLQCKRDIYAFKNWEWRYNYFETVSFYYMLHKFWKPLKPELFYKDLSFLAPFKENEQQILI